MSVFTLQGIDRGVPARQTVPQHFAQPWFTGRLCCPVLQPGGRRSAKLHSLHASRLPRECAYQEHRAAAAHAGRSLEPPPLRVRCRLLRRWGGSCCRCSALAGHGPCVPVQALCASWHTMATACRQPCPLAPSSQLILGLPAASRVPCPPRCSEHKRRTGGRPPQLPARLRHAPAAPLRTAQQASCRTSSSH